MTEETFIWVGVCTTVGGYEGDHIRVIVANTMREVIEKLWAELSGGDPNFTIQDGEEYGLVDAANKGGLIWSEGSLLVEKVKIGDVVTLMPLY